MLNLELPVLFFRKFFIKIKKKKFFRKKASIQKKKFSEIENYFLFYPVPLVKKIAKKIEIKKIFIQKKTILLFLRFLTKLKFYIGYRI